MRWLRCWAIVAAYCFLASAAFAEKRVALVVGNSKYIYAGELANPRNDASDMADELRKLGFIVIDGYNLDKAGLDQKIRAFASDLSGADVGVFFYAGHGLQVSGVNYIVPVDAQLSTANALHLEMIRLDDVQQAMEKATKTSILFLDACRDNPLARNLARALGTRGGGIGQGLAPAESGIGTLISFSTRPGDVALDGKGRNSPFTGPLVRRIATPGEDVMTTLMAVRNEVLTATDNKQVPWENHALRSKFYFNPAKPVVFDPKRTQSNQGPITPNGDQHHGNPVCQGLPDCTLNLPNISGQYAPVQLGPIAASKNDDRPPPFIDAAGAREAQNLVKRVISDAAEVGWERVFNRINTENRRYKHGNQKWGIYSFVISASGLRMAHGGQPEIVGQNVKELQVGATYPGRAILACAKSEFPNGCWTVYSWYNQISKRLEPKVSWIQQVGDYFVGAGVYIPDKNLKSLPLIADANDHGAKNVVAAIKAILEKSPSRIDVSYKEDRDAVLVTLADLRKQDFSGNCGRAFGSFEEGNGQRFLDDHTGKQPEIMLSHAYSDKGVCLSCCGS